MVSIIIDTFSEFVGHLGPEGRTIANFDCPGVRRLLAGNSSRALTYSLDNPEADILVRDIKLANQDDMTEFTPIYHGRELAPFTLCVPGRHNISNALATMLAAFDTGCSEQAVRRALHRYRGARGPLFRRHAYAPA